MSGGRNFWPLSTEPAEVVLWPVVIFASLFALAIFLEVMRQRRGRKRRVEKAWDTVGEIAKEKDFSENTWRLLYSLIEACSPTDPLEVVTVRRRFNQCVEAFLKTLRATGDMARYARVGAELRDLRVRLALDFVPFHQPIDTTRDIPPGQMLLAARTSEGGPRWFRLTVVSVDEAYLHAAFDHSRKDVSHPTLRPGDELRCRFWRADDARYTFTSTVARLEEETGQALLNHPADLQRIQARGNYRVRLNVPVMIDLVDAPSDGNYENVRVRPSVGQIRGRLVDLSAGGLAVELSQALPRQVLIRMTLDLEDLELCTVNARIVETVSQPSGRCLVRGAYVDVEEETRDAIAHYVWLRQQPQMKRDDGEH